jgi:hypothetical protein
MTVPSKPFTVFLFGHEGGVLPHLVSLITMGTALRQTGCHVLLGVCNESFHRCVVMDGANLPTTTPLETRRNLCEPCKTNVRNIMKMTEINGVNLKQYVTPELREEARRFIASLPTNLDSNDYEGEDLVRCCMHDVILSQKVNSLSALDAPHLAYLWEILEEAYIVRRVMRQIIRRHGIDCVIFFNQYFLNIAAKLAAEDEGIRTRGLTTANHQSMIRTKLHLIRDMSERFGDMQIAWPRWRDISLTPSAIE